MYFWQRGANKNIPRDKTKFDKTFQKMPVRPNEMVTE